MSDDEDLRIVSVRSGVVTDYIAMSNKKKIRVALFVMFWVGVDNSPIDPVIVTRSEWQARPPTSIQPMDNPVPYVVIHHSYIPPACYNLEDCIGAMQWMQDLHQINNSWVDIGYSFAVGSDGRAYEGRGWSRVGAHAPHFNNKSIGICVIGDWRESLPPEQQLSTVHRLIHMGVRDGKIVSDYKLVGHKQVRYGTLCPGNKLWDEIKSWPNYYNCTPDTIPELSTQASSEYLTPSDATPIEATPSEATPSEATPGYDAFSDAPPIDVTPSGINDEDEYAENRLGNRVASFPRTLY